MEPRVELKGFILIQSQMTGTVLDLHRPGNEFPISWLLIPGNKLKDDMMIIRVIVLKETAQVKLCIMYSLSHMYVVQKLRK